jgi:hypothetical protein
MAMRISGAEKSPIAFICELKKQVRFGLVVLGERKPAISNGAGVAHVSNPQRNIMGIQAQEKDLVPRSAAGRARGAGLLSRVQPAGADLKPAGLTWYCS